MKELLLSFLIALVVGSAINGLYQSEIPSGETTGQQEPSPQKTLAAVKEATDLSFEKEVLQSDLPVLVDFWAAWCAPCKKMLPIVHELAQDFDGQLKVVSIDIDANPRASAQYKIKEIPTFMLFKNGSQIKTLIGATSKDHLAYTIEHCLYK